VLEFGTCVEATPEFPAGVAGADDDKIDWLDQTRMRAFLRSRGWQVPWLGPFAYSPHATRQLFHGGPTALLGLAYREEDGRVTPVSLTFESATDERIRASSMEHAPWLSEIGRDILGAATAGRVAE
jgi:hypothetical protein